MKSKINLVILLFLNCLLIGCFSYVENSKDVYVEEYIEIEPILVYPIVLPPPIVQQPISQPVKIRKKLPKRGTPSYLHRPSQPLRKTPVIRQPKKSNHNLVRKK